MPVTPSIQVSKSMANNPVIAIVNSGDESEKAYSIYELVWEDSDWLISGKLYEGVVFTAGANANIDISFLFSDYRYVATVLRCRAYIDEGGSDEASCDFYLYGGGISKLARKVYGNFLTDRLDNPHTNFFLTSRTSQRIIAIPENELAALGYYSGDDTKKKFYIRCAGQTVETIDHTALAIDTPQSLDLAALRISLAASTGVLHSVFDIVTDTGYACTVLITEAETATNYRIRFINSLGASEYIALYGDLDFIPELEQKEKVSVYNSTVSDFIDEPQAATMRMIYNFSAAVRTMSDRLFVLDMLLAKEQYFYIGSRNNRCKVTADNLSWTRKPGFVSLRIELLYSEDNFTPIDYNPIHSILTTADGDPIQFNDTNILM